MKPTWADNFNLLRPRNSPRWIVFLAFILRLSWIILGHTYKFKTLDDDFGFGFEMGRIGRSLATGEGFSNPFGGATGSTAWEPPLYPFIIAAVFKLFGVYSQTSAIILLSINSIFSSLTCVPIFVIAERCFDKTVARWTSWLWAVLPPIMFWSTRWVWETSLAALLLSVIFWLTILMEEKEGFLHWFWFGFLWGATALTNPSLLAFLPASGLWICYRRLRRGTRFLGGVVLSALVFALCISPWIVRNQQALGKFIFIRANFGAELRLGNGPGADGRWMEYLHPTKNSLELQRYKELGEMAYVAERKREAMDFIREDYSRFGILCINRFFFYWGGLPNAAKSPLPAFAKNSIFLATSLFAFFGLLLALHKDRPCAWLFFWLVVCYPLVFYIVFPHPRYRHPIEPELGILIVFAINEIWQTLQSSPTLRDSGPFRYAFASGAGSR